jgi:GNAT superfamily N-acetyltransferase
MAVQLRLANENDTTLITSLIARSARTLGLPHYPAEVIEAALQTTFGLDTQLIRDKTYFIASEGDQAAGCGGWSFRETLFGSDREPNRSADPADPSTGAAKIRAFFVLPEFARRGVASLLLQRCEAEARQMGFRKLQLMSTLPGLAFYKRHGFEGQDPIVHRLSGNLTIRFVPMHKTLTGLGG